MENYGQSAIAKTDMSHDRLGCDERPAPANLAAGNRELSHDALSNQRVINSRLLEAIGRASGGLPESSGSKPAEPPRSAGTLHATRETLSDLRQEQDVTANLLCALEQII